MRRCSGPGAKGAPPPDVAAERATLLAPLLLRADNGVSTPGVSTRVLAW